MREEQTDRRGGETGCVLITGGTGSFGSAFARFLLAETACKMRIYSRDEHKQAALARELAGTGQTPGRVTFILGDVRDAARLAVAADGCEAIVHAAALKTVPAAERHVDEFVKTNIAGSLNVIAAALAARVSRTLLISSDKAVRPLNAYGKTKAVAEALFVQANEQGVTRAARFAVVRGGNVWGSRGSVVEVWRQAAAAQTALVVHDPAATRFHLPMGEWVRYVWRALHEMHGGEIFAPKLRAWRLGDLAVAFEQTVRCEPARPGDKPAELLIDPLETYRTRDAGWSYVVEPSEELRAVWNYQGWPGAGVPAEFQYSSETASRLSVAELKGLIDD